jgi:hypothetical protein
MLVLVPTTVKADGCLDAADTLIRRAQDVGSYARLMEHAASMLEYDLAHGADPLMLDADVLRLDNYTVDYNNAVSRMDAAEEAMKLACPM